MAHQLSIFVENSPGKLERITKILADEKLNVRGICLANAGEFGIVKIIVDDPDKAYDKLKEHHFTVSKRNIIAVRIDDKSGSLCNLLTILSSNKINIEDCYGVSVAYNNSAAIIIEVEKYPDVESVLKKNNIETLTDKEVYSI
ncbi:MAG TPA: hypothetical protein PLG34_07400 [Spirochaetota bacterium]|jgi:hypothetical protein|nr:MAG: acetolactate synthase 3 regulatory subunit [Spirochaetes bacterium ADurb.Bin133]HNZ26415.1 hypothetical protein [Spirochaetota bacterium]HPY87793.1 hypothetical protein [Spirochaetota bacterium]HQB61747.1 hypothetical protein [Spirochaetota bacterium]